MERFLKGIHTVLLVFALLCVTVGIAFAEDTATTPGIEEVALNASSVNNTMNLVYVANNQGVGWKAAGKNGEVVGDPNANMQAFAISIPGSIGQVQYRSLIDGGWQSWTKGSTYTGSENSNKSIEAVQMQLSDGAEKRYDLYYRVNVENVGWLDWAKNGETAGTDGLHEGIRELQVTYTEKDANAPGSTDHPVFTFSELNQSKEVVYKAHISQRGWQDTKTNGQTAGTTGESLSIEALTVDSPNLKQLGDNSTISYRLYCKDIGWTNESTNGNEAGTTGQSIEAEAAQIHLTGRAAGLYDVYYRVHSAYYNWFDWAKNGETAGTTGIDSRAEAIEIQIVPKNSPAPGSVSRPSVTFEQLKEKNQINYNTNVENIGWQQGFSNGMEAGTIGRELELQAFKVEMPNHANGSQLTYQAHVANIGWMNPVTDSNVAGTIDDGNAIEAISIALTGEDSYSYDVYYQVHCQNYGWLGWAKNGEYAGTAGGGLRMEALRIELVPHGGAAPGSTDNAYLELKQPDSKWYWPLDGIYNISSGFGYRFGENHLGIDVLAPQGTPIKAAKSGNVTIAGPYYGYGNCVVISNDNTGEECFYAHMVAVNTTPGSHVNQGDIIGFVGSTGISTANHLHFGVRDHGTWINPMDLF